MNRFANRQSAGMNPGHSFTRRNLTCSIAALTLIALPTARGGGFTSWQVPSGNWDVAANWNNGTPAYDSVAAIIVNGGSAIVPSGITAGAGTMGLENGSHLTISGGTLHCTQILSATNQALPLCNLTVSSGAWNLDGQMTLGTLGDVILNLSGGTISCESTELGTERHSATTAGTGIANVTGGTWNNTGVFTIARSGEGELNMTGGTVTCDLVQVATNADGVGSIALNGGTLQTSRVELIGPGSSFTFNGGTFKCTQDNWNIVSGPGIHVASGGAIIDTNGRNVSVSSLNGAGSLTKTGLGQLSPVGDSLYLGGTTVRNGTLVLDDANIGGTFNGDIIVGQSAFDAGTLQLTNGAQAQCASATVAPALGSAGVINVSNSTFRALNAMTIGVFGTATVTVSDAGHLELLGGNTLTLAQDFGFVPSNGTLNLGTGGAPGFINIATINGGAGNATVNFNHSGDTGYNTVFAGSIKIIHSGSGVTSLGANNTYTGATTVDAGTLRINGSLGNTAVAVNSGGTLGGSGTIAGAVAVNSGGWLSPGTSAGALTLNNLNLNADSITKIELAGTMLNQYDRIVAAGNVAVGGTLDVQLIEGFTLPAAAEFIILSVGGTATGTFDGLAQDALVGVFDDVELRISYTAGDGNDVSLIANVSAPCLGDLDGDNSRTGNDVQGFATCLISGGNCAAADMDGQNGVTPDDVPLFIAALLSGSSCP